MRTDIASHTSSLGRAARRRDAGFTLLEVIVATALAALALVALFQAGSAGLLTVGTATRLELAVDRAQSHLAEFADTGVVVSGEREGDDGDGYHWRLTARPIASRSGEASDRAAPPSLYDIAVTISWGKGHHRRSIQLETERIASAGAP
ncbi:MAG: prepilin-type N-terminal cleavage/methylation domain-containing protein, partial [Paraburkholderia sp.]|nr:prepilin-type N-terminal cleavage/methylation domain-containing protein [Paraburkholderia sp.]